MPHLSAPLQQHFRLRQFRKACANSKWSRVGRKACLAFRAARSELRKRSRRVTGKRLQVKVFAAGEMVKPFEVFDAVSSGVADMYHSAEYYWEKQSPGFNFFAAVPFGFTADEMAAWIHFGGGQALWDELSAKFNIKPLLSTNTGVQMGGWFTKEVKGPESYSGLKYRMPGLGGEVLRRLGAVSRRIARRRDRAGSQIRRDRRERMGWAVERYGVGAAQGIQILLLSGIP